MANSNYTNKIRNRLLLVILIFICNQYQLHSQVPIIEWQKTIGGDNSDYGNSIIPANDGGYLVYGSSFSGISGNKTVAEFGDGDGDIFLIKLDTSGSIIWQKAYGGNGAESSGKLISTPDGGYIFNCTSSSYISGNKSENNNGGKDIWVVKIDVEGNIEWQNTIGGSSDDVSFELKLADDGGFLIAGYSESEISGDKTEACLSPYKYDLWIIKLNVIGEIEWQNTIGGDAEDILTDINNTYDGGYILAAKSNSGISGDKLEGIIGGYDVWVIKINATGDIEWQNTIGGTENEQLPKIYQSLDSNYLLSVTSASDISGDKTEENIGDPDNVLQQFDHWVLKLDTFGNILWQNTIGGVDNDYTKNQQQLETGLHLIYGTTYSGSTGDITTESYGFGYADFWAYLINDVGEITWQQRLGGSIEDGLEDVLVEDNKFIFVGNSSSNVSGNKSENSYGNFDYWVVKIQACIPETCNGLDDDCDGLFDEDTPAPNISITTPGSTTICPGASLTLTASHDGEAVQWYKYGTPIPGASSESLTVTYFGNYSCTSASACGESATASIFVNNSKPFPATIFADGPTFICSGEDVLLQVTAVPGASYQWYKGAFPIAGATSTTYTASIGGKYHCKVLKIATGCIRTSNTITVVTIICKNDDTAIFTDYALTIYPNPSSTTINIIAESKLGKIEIFDMTGNIVLKESSEENYKEIDISSLASGCYYIKASDRTVTFIKQ